MILSASAVSELLVHIACLGRMASSELDSVVQRCISNVGWCYLDYYFAIDLDRSSLARYLFTLIFVLLVCDRTPID